MIIYNLFPLLAGPFAQWDGHLNRAAAMGFDWVFVNHPEFADGPCVGFEIDDLETPQECAVAVTTAFKEFAASDEFPDQ